MRSSFSSQLAIWLSLLTAFLLSVGHSSGHYVVVGLLQGSFFFLAARGIVSWEKQLARTSLSSWIFVGTVGLTLLASGLFLVVGTIASGLASQ
jgi:hypothetical protein